MMEYIVIATVGFFVAVVTYVSINAGQVE